MLLADAVISVIMPCFNAATTIRRSITAALKQEYQNIELLVVDDGSNDNSLAIIKSIAETDSRLNLIEQYNSGPAAARNAGLSHAEGAFVAFLDADDTWNSSCLMELCAPLNSDKRLALAYCGWQNLWTHRDDQKPFIPPNYQKVDKNLKLFTSCRWPIHAALTRRECIERAGGFDESLSSCMDFDLWLKIGSSAPIARVAKVLAYYHHHSGEQITKNTLRVATNHHRVQRNFLRNYPDRLRAAKASEVRRAMYEPLRDSAFKCYWQRDLLSARPLFRKMIRNGYGTMEEWKYMLPSLLPLSLHKRLLCLN